MSLVLLRPTAGSNLAELALAVTAVVLIAVFNLGHFSQGWVQWGYRFSLDFLPFLLPLPRPEVTEGRKQEQI